MPSTERGGSGRGGRRPGAGRPPSLNPLRDHHIRLTMEQVAAIRAFGNGNLSAGVRRMYEELLADTDDD